MKLVIEIELPEDGYGVSVEQDSDWLPKIMRKLTSMAEMEDLENNGQFTVFNDVDVFWEWRSS